MEKIEKVQKEDYDKTPLVTFVDGANLAPFEDSGGIWRFYEMVEAVNDINNPDHSNYIEWQGMEEGERIDLTKLDTHKILKKLKQVK